MSQQRHLLWENDDLDEADAAEDEKGAGHVAAETVVDLFGVLHHGQTRDIHRFIHFATRSEIFESVDKKRKKKE